MGDIATSSTQMRGGLGQCCHVCVIHLETVRTVRTLLALSYGSATTLGFEWRFEGSSPSSLPLSYTAPEEGAC